VLTVVVLVSLAVGVLILFQPVLLKSKDWHATITPLASIIGSGFLVVVPLLAATVGAWAPLAMAAVVAYAYVVGWALRLNIRDAEPPARGNCDTISPGSASGSIDGGQGAGASTSPAASSTRRQFPCLPSSST
jgi:hypothetical protein